MNKKIEIADIDSGEESSLAEETDTSGTPNQEAGGTRGRGKESEKTAEESIEQKVERHQERIQKLEERVLDLLQKHQGQPKAIRRGRATGCHRR